ncbi:MAG: hypothetical protein RIN55_05745 [Tissierellaceae bacterium]|nr:hypothetical protein [Tissierellaceae bacterium]
MADNLYKIAAQLIKNNPGMKHYEALKEAKKIIKEKEPIAGKQNRSLEK